MPFLTVTQERSSMPELLRLTSLLVWQILLVTYPIFTYFISSSLTKPPFSFGDPGHSTRGEIKIGLPVWHPLFLSANN